MPQVPSYLVIKSMRVVAPSVDGLLQVSLQAVGPAHETLTFDGLVRRYEDLQWLHDAWRENKRLLFGNIGTCFEPRSLEVTYQSDRWNEFVDVTCMGSTQREYLPVWQERPADDVAAYRRQMLGDWEPGYVLERHDDQVDAIRLATRDLNTKTQWNWDAIQELATEELPTPAPEPKRTVNKTGGRFVSFDDDQV